MGINVNDENKQYFDVQQAQVQLLKNCLESLQEEME
jgi:hypothetical protein